MASIGRGARIKGKNFEREVAKKLSIWYSEIKGENITLRRVPNSGGLNIKGDIMTEDISQMKNFPLHLELKKQERFNVRDYYTQSENDAPAGKIPTVIFSKNNDYTFIMMKLDDFCNFTKGLNMPKYIKEPVRKLGGLKNNIPNSRNVVKMTKLHEMTIEEKLELEKKEPQYKIIQPMVIKEELTDNIILINEEEKKELLNDVEYRDVIPGSGIVKINDSNEESNNVRELSKVEHMQRPRRNKSSLKSRNKSN